MLGIYSIYIWYIYCTIKAFSVMGLTVYKQIKDKITFNLSSIQRSLCQLTVQKTDKSDRDQFERGQKRLKSVKREEREVWRVWNEERGMWSVQSQRVTVTVKFWGRRDGLLNRFANSTIYSLQSTVFSLRSTVALCCLFFSRFAFVFALSFLCLFMQLPAFASLTSSFILFFFSLSFCFLLSLFLCFSSDRFTQSK